MSRAPLNVKNGEIDTTGLNAGQQAKLHVGKGVETRFGGPRGNPIGVPKEARDTIVANRVLAANNMNVTMRAMAFILEDLENMTPHNDQNVTKTEQAEYYERVDRALMVLQRVSPQMFTAMHKLAAEQAKDENVDPETLEAASDRDLAMRTLMLLGKAMHAAANGEDAIDVTPT